jgi:hypothetical protein
MSGGAFRRFDLGRSLVGGIRLSLNLDRRPHMSFSGSRLFAMPAVPAGQVQRVERAPDDPAAVIHIENVEAGPQAGDLGFDPELARGKAVESRDPGRGRIGAAALACPVVRPAIGGLLERLSSGVNVGTSGQLAPDRRTSAIGSCG